MTLIQDGNQIQSKMVDTNILRRFIPKEWADENKTTAKHCSSCGIHMYDFNTLWWIICT